MENKTLRRFFSFGTSRPHGGASVPHRKNTADSESVVMPPPERVIIAMQQHIGAPCEPTVKPGDPVAVGQVVGDTKAFVSAPIHASVSGTVQAITEIQLPGGQKTKAVVIESDGEQRVHESVQPPVISIQGGICGGGARVGACGPGRRGISGPCEVKSP